MAKIGLILIVLLLYTAATAQQKAHLPIKPRLLLYTAADAEKAPFKGDYSTGSIRYVWMICAGEMQKRMMPPKVYWRICDCVTDSLRRQISQSEYFGSEPKKQYEITFEVTMTCLNLMSEKDLM